MPENAAALPFAITTRTYVAPPCVPEDTTTPRFTTSAGTEYVRTPDGAFEGLPDWPYQPQYAEVEGMRMHYVDEGPADAQEAILLLHGQPSWSYLYRKMIPVLVGRGLRTIAMDHLGMGRSDKPTSLAEHTYLKQVARLKAFIRAALPDFANASAPRLNIFVQDWGSLIGLRVVAEESQWFRRVVIANGNLMTYPPGENPMRPFVAVNASYNCADSRNTMQLFQQRTAASPCGADLRCFNVWLNYALTCPAFSPQELMTLATARQAGLTPAEAAAYGAPYPTRTHMAAVRTFPSMVTGEYDNAPAWAALQRFERPVLCLAGDRDQGLGALAVQTNLIDNIAGAKAHSFDHYRYPEASHFIQEDVGADLATRTADFIEGTLVSATGTSTTDLVPTLTVVGVVFGLIALALVAEVVGRCRGKAARPTAKAEDAASSASTTSAAAAA